MYIVLRVCMTGYRLSIASDPGPTAAAATQATMLTLTAEDAKLRNKPNMSAAWIVRRTNAEFYPKAIDVCKTRCTVLSTQTTFCNSDTTHSHRFCRIGNNRIGNKNARLPNRSTIGR